MKFIWILLITILPYNALAQKFEVEKIESSIDEVTVYLQGAQISRSASIEIVPGRHELILESLSPFIDEKSLNVKALGDFKIISVKHRQNYLTRIDLDTALLRANVVLDSLHLEIQRCTARLEILKEKRLLLQANREISKTNEVSITLLRETMIFFDDQLSRIAEEEIAKNLEIGELKDEAADLEKQIADSKKVKKMPAGEISIRIESLVKTKADFSISYLIQGAGWIPSYDVRVGSIEEPLNLVYKAEVYQNTGVDWDNVKLRLSNGKPNDSGVIPELKTWYLNYPRNTTYVGDQNSTRNVERIVGFITDDYGEPLIGASVYVRGSDVGTVTNIDGKFDLTLPFNSERIVVSYVGFVSKELPITSNTMNIVLSEETGTLDEIAVVGYTNKLGSKVSGVRARSQRRSEANNIKTKTIENQTTVEFEVESYYSIKSSGDKLTISIKEYQIEAKYQYYAVPKLDKDAFVVARISDWEQFNLLEGEANLYFEEAYVGRTILNAKSFSDTLDISLGRDKNIVVGRIKVDEFRKIKTLGSNKIESRAYKIIVRNKKSSQITLNIVDQIPVAAISNIEILAKETSAGKIDDQSGEVKWDLEIGPQEQKELLLNYEIKYPRRENLVID